MRILHVSYADSRAGAAIAAMRLHRALLRSGIDSSMTVIRKYSNDPSVNTPLGRTGLVRVLGAQFIVKHGRRLFGYSDRSQYSYNLFRSGLQSCVDSAGADVVHLHWVGAETMSIAEIGRIDRPLVWTLHDMWPICGADHYGVERIRPSAFVDLDRWTSRRKAKHWNQLNATLICPSRWMAEQVGRGSLLKNAATCVIPNAIDTDLFKPIDRGKARAKFGLPQDKRLVLFGALKSTSDERKGFDLLCEALIRLAIRPNATSAIELVVFGADEQTPLVQDVSGFRVHFRGRIENDNDLSFLYSAADVFVAPSRQDNLPNTLVEAQACGTPSIAFDVGGIADVVKDGTTGALVPAFDTAAFADAIDGCLSWDSSFHERCRQHATEHFGSTLIAKRHAELYGEILRAQ